MIRHLVAKNLKRGGPTGVEQRNRHGRGKKREELNRQGQETPVRVRHYNKQKGKFISTGEKTKRRIKANGLSSEDRPLGPEEQPLESLPRRWRATVKEERQLLIWQKGSALKPCEEKRLDGKTGEYQRTERLLAES